MLISTRWQVALRLIASALIFESAVSFCQPVFHKHRVSRKDATVRPSSPSPATAAVAGAFLHKSSLSPGRPAFGGPRSGHRRRETASQDRALPVLMLATGGDRATAASAAATAGDISLQQSSNAAVEASPAEAQVRRAGCVRAGVGANKVDSMFFGRPWQHETVNRIIVILVSGICVTEKNERQMKGGPASDRRFASSPPNVNSVGQIQVVFPDMRQLFHGRPRRRS